MANAASQVMRTGDEAQLKQATEAMAETRKRLYGMLAD